MATKLDTHITAESLERNFILLNRALKNYDDQIAALQEAAGTGNGEPEITEEINQLINQKMTEIKKYAANLLQGSLSLDNYLCSRAQISAKDFIELSIAGDNDEKQLVFQMAGDAGEDIERGFSFRDQETEDGPVYGKIRFGSADHEFLLEFQDSTGQTTMFKQDAASMSLAVQTESNVAAFFYDAVHQKWKISYNDTAFEIGDMLKAVYDTNDDGKVNAADEADFVPWAGVQDTPTTLEGYGITDAYTAGQGEALESIVADLGMTLGNEVNRLNQADTENTAAIERVAADLAAFELSDLQDVDETVLPAKGHVLAFDGVKWRSRAVERNIDGGTSASVYLPIQRINGGGVGG
ncbi:hypothetical protein [Sporomusa termitida]|uniref:Uncharacterized protein n=1 Tax=Sporomusa termitida TaxID=2377 RepID=A0A517DS93_9FIRM|nr:hypothetical protein [Sporomusa termitida]QDR80234.1 hypothetical protein SPTER_15530 [Sporomusa termitida]